MNAGEEAAISVEALTVRLGAFHLQDLTFGLAAGEVLVILGPNGAGKSVTLETIAGFHRADGGRVLIGGRDVTALPPERRNVGFVVQNFGLFPHLSVAQNVAIARRKRHSAAAQVASPPHGDPAGLLAYFGVGHLAARAPRDLSPGEKQRVALARALAGAPDLFLFDEPFSALDAQTHDLLRQELKSFLRKLSLPAIFVTHDHTDAMILADQIVVLRDGATMQSGPAAEILQRPANSFVARFIGVENILPGKVVDTTGPCATIAVGERTLRAAIPAAVGGTPKVGFISIRAEEVVVRSPQADQPGSAAVNRFDGRVIGLRSVGPLVTVAIECGFALNAYLLSPQVREMNLSAGSTVGVEIAAVAVNLMSE